MGLAAHSGVRWGVNRMIDIHHPETTNMELTRLKELLESAQTAQAAEVLQEGAKHTKDFDGIRGIVDDCIADLREKIGKGGMLATLMKESGASKLDTVKDADGKNVLNQIIAKTTEYTKAIEKLMTEAEILISQVNEGAAALL